MNRRLAGVAVALAIVAAACGKKGNPLPPIRPVPDRVGELAAHRVDDRVDLQLIIPSANADGSQPLVITRVEIFRAPVFTGAPPPAPAQILADSKNLRTEIPVRRVIEGAPAAVAKLPLPPVPGERTTFVDRIDTTPKGGSGWTYVAVGSAGRGRRGVPTSVTVPNPPPAPEAITIAETETTLTLTWKPAATGQAFNVFAVTQPVDVAAAQLLNPKPLTTATFAVGTEFGRERCFAVRSMVAAAAVTVEGNWSAPVCVTPVDRYPPPAPANLAAVQDGTSVVLTWTAVTSADLAGYVVLRGEGAGIDMRPLLREPIRETTYRDTAVQPGSTYTYTVYATDNAPGPNVSQQSSRQVITVR